MKRFKEQLSIKAHFSTIFNLVALILIENSMKGLRVTKIVKEIRFEGVWGNLKAKKKFHPQPITK